MPVTITQQQLNELKAIADKGINNPNLDVRVEYYNKLISYGDQYAKLALAVVKNEGFAGKTANAYMAEVASDAGKPFTASQNLVFSKNLMARDFSLRKTAFDNKSLGGNIELGYQQIQAYHTGSLKEKLQLDPTAWTAFIPLKYSSNPQETWNKMINVDGGIALGEYSGIFIDVAGEAFTNTEARNYISQFFLLGEVSDYNSNLVTTASYLVKSGFGAFSTALSLLPNKVGTAGITGLVSDITGIIGTGHGYITNTIANAFNSFSSLTGFESTSSIGDFSFSSSNTIKTFATTNSSVSNLGFIIGKSSNYVSPLTFDLDGDGIETNHIYSQNVYFDIDADGFAEKIGWIKADDGQLAFDANKNGKIDDITELFGDDKQPAFDKLKTFDTNKNGKIDAGRIVIANERSEVWQSPLKSFNDNDLKSLNEIATACLSTLRNDGFPLTPSNDNHPMQLLQSVA